jgi:hypothetical protein
MPELREGTPAEAGMVPERSSVGEIVRRVSGRSLADFAEKRIFAPLGIARVERLGRGCRHGRSLQVWFPARPSEPSE